MIDGIRRRFGKETEGGSWNSDLEQEPEIGEDAAVSVVLAYSSGRYSPDNASAADHYKRLVQTAIRNGGRYGGHQISIPWLRMILAGLESERIDPSVMWQGVESGETEGDAPKGIPSYEDLFQSGPGDAMTVMLD